MKSIEKVFKEIFKNLMIENINKVLNGEIESIELLYCRPINVLNYIESIGGEEIELDRNGRQWDYWMKLEVNGEMYQLSGDGFYQSSAVFKKLNIEELKDEVQHTRLGY